MCVRADVRALWKWDTYTVTIYLIFWDNVLVTLEISKSDKLHGHWASEVPCTGITDVVCHIWPSAWVLRIQTQVFSVQKKSWSPPSHFCSTTLHFYLSIYWSWCGGACLWSQHLGGGCRWYLLYLTWSCTWKIFLIYIFRFIFLILYVCVFWLYVCLSTIAPGPSVRAKRTFVSLFLCLLLCFFLSCLLFKTGFLCITEPWLSWAHFGDQPGLKLTEICSPLPLQCSD